MSLSESRLGLQQRKHPKPTLTAATTTTPSSYNVVRKDNEDANEKKSLLKETKLNINQRNSIKQVQREDDGDGHVLIPLQQQSLWKRLDVGPFLFLYLVLIWLDQVIVEEKRHGHGVLHLLQVLAFPVVLMSHLGLVIAQQWRVSVKSKVGYKICHNNPNQWTHCWVRDARHHVGRGTEAEICPITFEDNVAIVNFHDVIFRANLHNDKDEVDKLFSLDNKDNKSSSSTNTTTRTVPPKFKRLKYPDDLNLDVYYKKWKGLVSLTSARTAQQVYGSNTTHIQLPPFMELLGQQLLAPFFLFQLLCVGLWSLDEYWYYAIFTLFALILFECTVAYNRLKGLERLRQTLRHAYPILVYRHHQWISIQTTELLPGDIVSLLSSSQIMVQPKQHTTKQQKQQQQLHELHVPADILLIQGNVVVDEALLTGESIPQLKGPLDISSTDFSNLNVEDSQHKQSILFGGTVLVSHDNDCTTDHKNDNVVIPTPPNKGVMGVCLRTGFETAQGSLLRTMAHSSNPTMDGMYTRDTFIFVCLLLACAIGSALAVFHHGWHDETRNRFRLLLHVIIIITSVVPPELPMELSLAVTNSVADLMKRCSVYCTEPHRIPWAGRVSVCAFDKTGTLTSDEMQLKGVVLANSTDFCSEEELPWHVERIMVACQSLAPQQQQQQQQQDNYSSSTIIGDPLEKAVLNGTNYKFIRAGLLGPKDSGDGPQIQIHHRFAFSSRLKRMTVLLTETKGSNNVWAVSKGAPETLKSLLQQDSIPANFEDVCTKQMSRGRRVLAIAHRNLGQTMPVSAWKESRTNVEQDLIFAGFLVFDCPLKTDSKQVVGELQRSAHDVVMITGDAVLTATEVARQVGILPKTKNNAATTYELRESSNKSGEFAFYNLANDKDDSISLKDSNLKNLKHLKSRSEASFCVSGAVLFKVAERAVLHNETTVMDASAALNESNVLFHPKAQAVLKDVVPIISVFARHGPRQKEAVVAAFNLAGRVTAYVGDGSNDVASLKRAHVGISIISAPDVEAKQRDASAKHKAEKKKKGKKSSKNKKVKNSSSMLEESLRQLREAQEELDYVELGDASVASPFTSRAVSIKCCKDVLQQGRCTLVTMLQIYKILGVNSLVNALVLTKLHMHGVKQGDRQLTVLGVAVSVLFFFITRGKPLPTLSPHRPPSSVLCRQALLSIAVQFTVHAVAILAATHMSMSYVDPWDPSIIPDGPFNPNVLNSCTFLLTGLATINTFVVNYRGRPFMQDLRHNTLLVRGAGLCYVALFACALEVFPPLNDLLQLSPLPDTSSYFGSSVQGDSSLQNVSHAFLQTVGFPVAMCILMIVDTILAYASEKAIVWYFEGSIA